MGTKIDGKLIAEKFREEIKAFVLAQKEEGKSSPKLSVIFIGNDGGSLYYVKNTQKLANSLGVECDVHIIKEDASEDSVIDLIEKLNLDKEVNGIMLQIPLPQKFNEGKIISKIDYKKDVDGLTHTNIGRFFSGEKSYVPCTPKGIIELIKSTGLDIAGKRAVVIGRSNIVGKPVAQLLLNENATVTICHSKTKDLKKVCSEADILISAIGRPNFVNKEFVKEGAIVIDVGTTMVEGKLKGDVIFEEVIEKASFVTPVPGGVGAMTTTMLLKNTCEALKGNVY